ncbi:MAG: 5-formyltetrahydrofolate cyclo-ligase, partial [Hymenobacteraceae bacterium]|nr:5-formyltetrahydrofolate cyclo-ligase [Hymenobacteraceae bacterium]MDX5394885.1 5-formyltetrahydrofolate cyclo-ligase [Hymenobacteraceae bacterium]MDX5510919.1 5-formyltetrahydrofolate cyclo-ligase [Hymenobacteraceae bacterium]
MQKKDLRRQMLQFRKELAPEEAAVRSRQIADRFFNEFSLNGVKTVHVFLPIVEKNEINTWLIINRLWQEFPEIKIAVPVTDFNACE